MTNTVRRLGKILSLTGLLLYTALIITHLHPQRLSLKEKPRDLPAAEEEGVFQFTEGFRYTESEKGKVTFSISAEQVLGYKRDTYKLENVSITFVTEDGNLQVSSRKVDFNAGSRDFGIEGNVVVKTPLGLTLWTDEMTYQNRSRLLIGTEKVYFAYNDDTWGTLENPVLDTRRNIMNVLEGVTVQDVWGDYFTSSSVDYHLKTGHMEFPKPVIAVYGDLMGVFRRMQVHRGSRSFTVEGECGDLRSVSGVDHIFAEAPVIHAIFPRGGHKKPRFIKMDEGGEWIRGEERAKAGLLTLHLKKGKFSHFSLDRNFRLVRGIEEISGIQGGGRFDDAGKLSYFRAFGNVVVCMEKSLVRSEYLTAKMDKDRYDFREDCFLRRGAMELTSNKMTYFKMKDQVQVHGDVHVLDTEMDRHVNADHALVIPGQNASTFTGNVHSWTPEYDVTSKALNIEEEKVKADGEVHFVHYAGEGESLKAETVSWDRRDQIFHAAGDVHLVGKAYTADAQKLEAGGEGGAWTNVSMTGDVSLVDEKEGVKGWGERLDLLRDGSQTIFLEGCPAKIVDREGQTLTSPVIILDRSSGQIYLLGKNQPSVLEVKNDESLHVAN